METTVVHTKGVVAPRTLRPSRALFTQSGTVAAALTLPVFAAMLWFAIPRGTWPRVLVAIAFITTAYAIAVFLLSRVRIIIEADGMIEHGFFSHNRRVAAKRIESALIVQVYRGQSMETAPQLFLLDASGELLLRLRGQYWGDAAVRAAAGAYGVPIRESAEPLTWAQLRADHPDLLYWFERWPWARTFCIVGGIAALSLILIALMSSTNL
jgi:hypothetical protein